MVAFLRSLGISERVAEMDAEGIEHHVSPKHWLLSRPPYERPPLDIARRRFPADHVSAPPRHRPPFSARLPSPENLKSNGMEEGDLILYEFSRSKVEREDFSHFLGMYGPDKLPTGRRLRAMMNSMLFCIGGYDHDPREIYKIPEVRQFYRKFHDAWPYWFYFCNLDTDVMKTMVTCCLDDLVVIKIDNQPQVAVQPVQLELIQFMSRELGKMNKMCARGKMFERLVYDRSKILFEYFGLPFDEPPPG